MCPSPAKLTPCICLGGKQQQQQSSASIVGGGKPVPGVLRVRRGVRGGTHHEGSVQRIRAEAAPPPVAPADSGVAVYQRHWFSRELELLAAVDERVRGGRDARLDTLRTELRRHLRQMRRGGRRNSTGDTAAAACERIRAATIARSNITHPGISCETCGRRPALPCTRHCALHIMQCRDQCLFDCCTAKFADNTQCDVPVVDVQHELPLCAEHARKRDNYDRQSAVVRPKKQRRKMKPSAMIRPQRRSKKRRREKQPQPVTVPTPPPPVTPAPTTVPDDVLEHALVTQASRLLEETDFTTVLNQIPADEFNDLFSDRNGEYEPSMEETEELERALRAVDNDVKSLEKLSQSHGLLDQLLADDTLTAELPDVVFHSAYVTPTPQ